MAETIRTPQAQAQFERMERANAGLRAEHAAGEHAANRAERANVCFECARDEAHDPMRVKGLIDRLRTAGHKVTSDAGKARRQQWLHVRHEDGMLLVGHRRDGADRLEAVDASMVEAGYDTFPEVAIGFVAAAAHPDSVTGMTAERTWALLNSAATEHVLRTEGRVVIGEYVDPDYDPRLNQG